MVFRRRRPLPWHHQAREWVWPRRGWSRMALSHRRRLRLWRRGLFHAVSRAALRHRGPGSSRDSRECRRFCFRNGCRQSLDLPLDSALDLHLRANPAGLRRRDRAAGRPVLQLHLRPAAGNPLADDRGRPSDRHCRLVHQLLDHAPGCVRLSEGATPAAGAQEASQACQGKGPGGTPGARRTIVPGAGRVRRSSAGGKGRRQR